MNEKGFRILEFLGARMASLEKNSTRGVFLTAFFLACT